MSRNLRKKNIGATAIARRLRADDLSERAQEYWVLRKCAQAPQLHGVHQNTFFAKKKTDFCRKKSINFSDFIRHFLNDQ